MEFHRNLRLSVRRWHVGFAERRADTFLKPPCVARSALDPVSGSSRRGQLPSRGLSSRAYDARTGYQPRDLILDLLDLAQTSNAPSVMRQARLTRDEAAMSE
jgi:hypothetical protein